MPLNLPYYYGHTGEQYAFFRIPKLLLADDRLAEVSTDAKLLYGLLLDRMELSYRNGWIDEQDRVFIILRQRRSCLLYAYEESWDVLHYEGRVWYYHAGSEPEAADGEDVHWLVDPGGVFRPVADGGHRCGL